MNLYCKCGNEITRKVLELDNTGSCCLECYQWLLQDRYDRDSNEKEKK